MKQLKAMVLGVWILLRDVIKDIVTSQIMKYKINLVYINN